MVVEPQHFQWAAGIDFDSIAPFVFVILIVVSQILSALKKKNARDADEEEPDVDALERARQIREEIRRKIEERRQEMETGPARRPQTPQYDPTKPDGQPRLPQRTPRTPEPKPQPVERRTGPAQPVYTPPARSGPTMEEQLAEQRKKLEAARQKQREARARAKQMLEKTGVEMRSKEDSAWQQKTYSSDFRKQLVGDLRNRNGLRTAVLLREILGKPLGLR